jgi:hypothetical protein
MLNELASELYRKLSQNKLEDLADSLPEKSPEPPSDSPLLITVDEPEWLILPPISVYSLA